MTVERDRRGRPPKKRRAQCGGDPQRVVAQDTASRKRVALGQCLCAYQPVAVASVRTARNGRTVARKTLPTQPPELTCLARRASAPASAALNAASERIAGA